MTMITKGHDYYLLQKGLNVSLIKIRGTTYILLTKREGRTGRISARGLDSTDRAQRYSPSTVPSKLG